MEGENALACDDLEEIGGLRSQNAFTSTHNSTVQANGERTIRDGQFITLCLTGVDKEYFFLTERLLLALGDAV